MIFWINTVGFFESISIFSETDDKALFMFDLVICTCQLYMTRHFVPCYCCINIFIKFPLKAASVSVTLQDGALWCRLYLPSGNHFMTANAVYLIHYPNSHCFAISAFKVSVQNFLFQVCELSMTEFFRIYNICKYV